MTQTDIVTAAGLFLWENMWYILLVVIVLTILMIYIVLNNIKFKKQKTKVEKVIVIEKFAQPPSFADLQQDVANASSNNKDCNPAGIKNGKDICTALGGCIWITADNGNVKKCVSGNSTDGPTDMCCCQGQTNGTGKLIPWDTFYYLDGKIKNKKAKPCMATGNKCTPQK